MWQYVFYFTTRYPEIAVRPDHHRLNSGTGEFMAKTVCTPFCNIGHVSFGMSSRNSNRTADRIVNDTCSIYTLFRDMPGTLCPIIESYAHIIAGDCMGYAMNTT